MVREPVGGMIDGFLIRIAEKSANIILK